MGAIAITEATKESHIYGRHNGALVFTLSAYFLFLTNILVYFKQIQTLVRREE